VQICFVRHAQPVPEINVDRVANPGLSELGVWQAERLTDWLATEPIDHIISSPKRRAAQTIQPLADRLGLEVAFESGFSEIDRNSKIYLPPEILFSKNGEYAQQAQAYVEGIQSGDYANIGWDNPDDFQERVLGTFKRLCETQPGKHIVVACHGGVISRILSELVTAKERLMLRVFYTGICRVWADDDKRFLMTFNEIGHCCASRDEVTGPMRDGQVMELSY